MVLGILLGVLWLISGRIGQFRKSSRNNLKNDRFGKLLISFQKWVCEWFQCLFMVKKKNFLGISSLKMDIFYIQSCIWPKTPIFDLRASSGRRANAPVEISNFFFVIGTQWSKIIRKNQWKDPFLLKKCLKNQIFWIFGFSKLQISMKISTHWPGMATLVYFLCFLNLCKLVGNKNNALGYWFWPKIDSDRAKFDPNYC